VTLSLEPGANGRHRLRVSDTGPGIDADRLDNVFEPFDRLGREALDIEGAGIGLAISKRLIESMGGAIGFTSRPGLGADFWIEIPPANAPAEPQFAPAPIPMPDGAADPDRPRLVLYVEDHPVNADLMRMVFRKMPNFELIIAEDAETGVEIARRMRPGLILMDVQLPGMSGVEALQVLQGMEETRDIPTVALSASAMKSDVEDALRKGFAGYMTKPVDLAELLALIRRVFEESAPLTAAAE